MGGFGNGSIPLEVMVKLGDTWYLPPGAAARWQWVQRSGLEKYGVWLVPSPGWTCFRPLSEQWAAWNRRLAYLNGGPFAASAAWPGSSNHGTGNAIDVYNWRALAPGNESFAWARFTALCRLAGFETGTIKGELWHIVLQVDAWAVPAFAAVTATPIPKEWDEMATKDEIKTAFREVLAESGGTLDFTVFVGDGDKEGRLFKLEAGKFRHITPAERDVLKATARRQGQPFTIEDSVKIGTIAKMGIVTS